MNQTKETIIGLFDKYMKYTFENDTELFSKLLRSEEECKELNEWAENEMRYLLGKGEESDYEKSIFGYIYNIICEKNLSKCVQFQKEIFNDSGELMEIMKLIQDICKLEDMEIIFELDYILDMYCYIYLYDFDSVELKEHIIELVDPVEPK